MAEREIIYLGRDNSVDLLLKASGTTQNLSSVTHMEVYLGSGTTISSSVSPSLFSGVTSSNGQVSLKFGTAPLSPGSYTGLLIVYDTTNTNGIMWGSIPMVVKS